MKPNAVSRRTWLSAGLSAGLGGWAALARGAGLPASNFRVQWRVMPWPPASLPAPPSPGSVTVATAGAATGSTPAPPGSQTTRVTQPGAETPTQQLVVHNGGEAQIVLRRDDTSAMPEWIWTALGGQGIQSPTRRLARRESLWIQLQWPGGAAPVRVGFRFEQPQADRADIDRGDAVQQVDSQLQLPLDQWQEVGHWSAPDGTGQALQLKLNRLP
jgi:hypothetical protein